MCPWLVSLGTDEGSNPGNRSTSPKMHGGVTAQTANGACSADLSSRLTGSCGWTITVTSGGRVILWVLDAIFGTKVYLCPRIKIGEIYEKVHVFSDGPAAVGGLFERSFDGA